MSYATAVLAKVIGIWLLILLFAVLNGVLRESLLMPVLGLPAGLVVSGVILCAVVIVVSLVLVPRLGALPMSIAVAIGLFWLALTLVFEFGFGRLVQHRPWSELLEAYRFHDGNIWPVVLLVVTLSPALAVAIRPRV